VTEVPPSRAGLLRWATERLRDAKVPDPGQESYWIWERVSRETRQHTFMQQDASPAPGQAVAFEQLVGRRAAGEPLAYVLGETSFRLLRIGCDRRALIPRPETEGLVDLVLARRPSGVALDVGTGTGCIALSLRHEGRFDRVIALDHSAGALGLARENAVRLGLSLDLVRGDLTTPMADRSVDVLVSNPPYLSDGDYRTLEPGVREWEPATALVTGEEGMEATRQLFYGAGRVVRPGGLLAAELDAAKASKAAGVARDAGWKNVTVLDDLFGRPRYLLAWRREES
jgi:release factor glutamine methyltransferase